MTLEEKQFAAIIDRLDKILRLLAVEAVKTKEREQDKIEMLESLGFKASDIDRFLGKSTGYSSVVLYQLKKKKQPKATADQTTGAGTTTSEAIT